MALVIILNTVFNQRGATELFRIGQRSFTKESLIFGLCIATMLAAVMLWFRLYQELITTDRFLYLFSPLAPTLALSITMVLRWIPLTRHRYEQLKAAQSMQKQSGGNSVHSAEGLARRDRGTVLCPANQTNRWDTEPSPVPRKFRSQLRVVSALMSWSMEDAIEAADSMQARGYGHGGDASTTDAPQRTSFRFYRFTTGDTTSLIYLATTALVGTITLLVSTRTLAFFPTVRNVGTITPLTLLAIAALMTYPLILEGKEQAQWLTQSR